jgi:hypothetical protein
MKQHNTVLNITLFDSRRSLQDLLVISPHTSIVSARSVKHYSILGLMTSVTQHTPVGVL